jgi:hypothetical protein
MIIDEANAISTAYLRLDLLAPPVRRYEQGLMRRYAEARVAGFRALPSVAAAQRQFSVANALAPTMWATAVAGCAKQPTPCSMLLLPALNAEFDTGTKRTLTAEFHPPWIVFAILIVLALVCSVMAGFATAEAATRNWFYMVCYASVVAFTLYTILEIEFPRAGFIRIDLSDDVLTQSIESLR